MISARIVRRFAVVTAIGALMIASSQARTYIPTSPEPAPQAAAPEARPASRPARTAVKKLAVVDPASCRRMRQTFFVEGEGWIVRSVSRCA